MTTKEELKLLRKEIESLRMQIELMRLTQPVVIPQPYPVYPYPPAQPWIPWYGETTTGVSTDKVFLATATTAGGS